MNFNYLKDVIMTNMCWIKILFYAMCTSTYNVQYRWLIVMICNLTMSQLNYDLESFHDQNCPTTHVIVVVIWKQNLAGIKCTQNNGGIYKFLSFFWHIYSYFNRDC